MASLEGESARVVEKFDGVYFHLWKFKMEMVLAAKDLWEIVEGSEQEPPDQFENDYDPKVFKAYQRRSKLELSIIATNLSNKQAAHIQHSRDPSAAWQILCDVHEQKSLSNILYVRRKFFTMKMQDGDDMLDHINKVKALADQLSCLDVPLRGEDVVMTLLQSLSDSYDYLIAALETRPIKELTLEYVKARLVNEVTKKKEKEAQGEDSAFVSRQGKAPFRSNANSSSDSRVCYSCGKFGHIARYCPSCKKLEKEKANHARVDDDYAFVVSERAATSSLCKWILDSGATQHMTCHRQAFNFYESIAARKVFMGDDGMVEAVGVGSILMQVDVKGVPKPLTIKNVLHVPKLQANLLSVSKMVANGCTVQFNKDGGVVKASNGQVLAKAPLEHNLYQITFKEVLKAKVASVAQSHDSLSMWHQRLGHLNMKSVRELQHMVSGMSLGHGKSNVSNVPCEACIEGKQQRQPFPVDSATRATKLLQIVHSDVCGSMRTTSIGGARFFVTFIDDLSRKVWVYPLKEKGEVFATFKEFKALVEAQSEEKIKVLRSDNGGEYMSKQFGEFLKQHGIERQTSAPYTPQQNRVAERMNRTLVEIARCMVHAKHLNLEL